MNSGLSHNIPKYLEITVAYSIAREVLAYGEAQGGMVEEDEEVELRKELKEGR